MRLSLPLQSLLGKGDDKIPPWEGGTKKSLLGKEDEKIPPWEGGVGEVKTFYISYQYKEGK
jgi:hypothetical protein